jgi:hypothetical protein
VHPPSLDRDTNAIESLDFAPPCGYGPHDERGHTGPAVWIALTGACACGDGPHWTYYCDPCWEYRNSSEFVHCPNCGSCKPTWQTVLRVERVGGVA